MNCMPMSGCGAKLTIPIGAVTSAFDPERTSQCLDAPAFEKAFPPQLRCAKVTSLRNSELRRTGRNYCSAWWFERR
jgi:hypothetical protein